MHETETLNAGQASNPLAQASVSSSSADSAAVESLTGSEPSDRSESTSVSTEMLTNSSGDAFIINVAEETEPSLELIHEAATDHVAPMIVRFLALLVGLTPKAFMLFALPILWSLILWGAGASPFHFFNILIVVATTYVELFHFFYPNVPTAVTENKVNGMLSIAASPNAYNIRGLPLPSISKTIAPLDLGALSYIAVGAGLSMEWLKRIPLIYPGFSALLPANILVFRHLLGSPPAVWLDIFGTMAGYMLVGITAVSQLARILVANPALPLMTHTRDVWITGITHSDAFIKRALMSVLPESVLHALSPLASASPRGYSYQLLHAIPTSLSLLEPIAAHLLPPIAVLTRYAREAGLRVGDEGYLYMIYAAEVAIALSLLSLVSKVCISPDLPLRGQAGEILTSLGFSTARFAAYGNAGVDALACLFKAKQPLPEPLPCLPIHMSPAEISAQQSRDRSVQTKRNESTALKVYGPKASSTFFPVNAASSAFVSRDYAFER